MGHRARRKPTRCGEGDILTSGSRQSHQTGIFTDKYPLVLKHDTDIPEQKLIPGEIK